MRLLHSGNTALWLILAVFCACGTIAEGDGGGDNLPSRRIVPFDKVTSDDEESDLPIVLSDETLSFDEPCAVVNSGQIEVFYQASDETTASIRRAFSTTGLELTNSSEILVAELDWEEGWVGAPSVLMSGGQYFLFYVGGVTDPAIGLARSSDGNTWTRETEPVFEADAGERIFSPSVVSFGGQWVMFFARAQDDPETDPLPTVIDRADSPDGLSWTRQGTVLDLGSGCTNDEGEEIRCWDTGWVGAPGVRVSTSPAGRTLVDIWYTGAIVSNSDIGFAGSYDGRTFFRYALNPVIEGSGRESAASVIDFGDSLLMYYGDRRDDRRVIGVARNQ